MSFNKPKAKSSVNQQVKAGLAAVRDFLAGHTVEPTAAQPTDKEARQEVAAELLAAMREAEGAAKTTHGRASGEARAADQTTGQKSGAGESKGAEGGQRTSEEQERARQLYVEHGYFDESVETLRSSTSSAERAAAARALGLVGSSRGTAHLIAAMFDEDAEVRSAAEEALAQIGEPTFKNAGAATSQSTEKPPMIEPSVLPRRTAEQTSAPGVARAESSVKEADQPIVVASSKAAAEAHREATAAEVPTRSHAKAKSATTHKAKSTESHALTVSIDPNAPVEEQELFKEETKVRERLAKLQQRIQDRVTARKESENEAQWRLERESKLLADAAAQRAKDEELRKQAEEEAALRRKQEIEAIAAEQTARVQAESKSQKLADDEIGLRAELIKLTNAAEDLLRRRVEMENARVAAAAAAREAEATRDRDEADKRHKAELDRLRNDQAMLQASTEKAAGLRAEVTASREKAERDAEALAEAQARMRSAEEARQKAEAARVKLEAELHLRVETEERLLAEARQRAKEEQARLEQEAHLYRESEEKRMAELETARNRAEQDAKERARREEQIRSQLDTLRIADAEVRKRIEDAEVRRRALEEAFKLVAEKVQRTEAEAHASKLEEEQILAKLETARRNAAVEAQARADQKKRIQDEIDMFRRLEEQERPRLEELMLQRSAAEAALQEQRESFRVEEEARSRAVEERQTLREYERTDQVVYLEESRDDTMEVLPATPSFGYGAGIEQHIEESTMRAEGAPSDVPPAIASYLHSVDPYKRAAAVAELARSQAKGAFGLITSCFDDHSPHVRNAAARALRKLDPHKTVDLFNRALEEGSPDRRRNIGNAIAASGLATEAINNLVGDNREDTYSALSILFVMAKTGEVQPLVQAIEEHENDEVCRAVIKLLTLSGQSDVGDAALQRRVMGVAAQRQKAAAARADEIPDFRLRIAEVEVKRAINSQHASEAKPRPDSKQPSDGQHTA